MLIVLCFLILGSNCENTEKEGIDRECMILPCTMSVPKRPMICERLTNVHESQSGPYTRVCDFNSTFKLDFSSYC